jgi:hypothetical protein
VKQEKIDRIKAEVGAWEYIKSLPKEAHGFLLNREGKAEGDRYDILYYENKARHLRVTLYYHDETWEYKVRTEAGMTSFCNNEFIAEKLEDAETLLKERFMRHLARLEKFNAADIDSIVVEKKILEWHYLDKIPKEIEGFKLFLVPQEPLKVLNGSYIVFDYSDFAAESNFVIYYNIFRDEFFGEAKIHGIPDMTYDFDSHELKDLEKLLDEHLREHLQLIRAKIEGREKL